MQRAPVDSSNIAEVGFDAATKTLEIAFKGGGVFQYVGPDTDQLHKGLMESESKGKYFNQNIRRAPNLVVTKISA